MINCNSKLIVKMFFLLSMFLLLSVQSFAQGKGTIKGNVTDQQGDPLPFVNVYLMGTTIGAATNSNGSYIINNVPPGKYTIRFSIVSYKTEAFEITVADNAAVEQNATMQSDVLQMEGVVITGTAGGVGIAKKDASFAISTLSPRDVEQLAPKSTAEILDMVPGVWSESTGGVAGANIMVRGLPSGGDAPFVTFSINGAPIYGTETLSFLEQSTLFRVDETIKNTEAVRGGPSSVFSNGEAGLTTNFNLIRGSDQTKGKIKYTTSDYNEQRIDAVLSGPVTNGLYYMVGGYFRTSPGIRNTQFNSERGQQVTLELTRVFDKGAVNAFSRITDDHGQWILPMAIGIGNDFGTFSPLGNATRYRTLRIDAQGDSASFDFANGRGWKGSVSGLNFDYSLGAGWAVRDNLSYTKGDADTYGFVPNGSPMSVGALTNKLGTSSIRTVGGQILTSGYVQSYGYWVVQKQIESLTNDISLTKTFDQHKLTFGAYQAFWSTDDFWTLGNHVLINDVTNGDLIAGVPADSVQPSWNYGLREAGDARVFALYAGDSWQMNDKWRLDLGARLHYININFTLDAGAHPDGTIDQTASLDGNDWAGTAALNYQINTNFGMFVRGSKGLFYPNFDNIREGNNYNLESGTITDGTISSSLFNQYELGLKYQQEIFSLFITGFYNTVELYDGGVGSSFAAAQLKTRTFGAEIDGGLSMRSFRVQLTGTLQDGEITESPNAPETVGKKIWRQPSIQFRLAPSYNFRISESVQGSVYGAIRYAGARWNDRDNSYQLDPYSKFDMGVDVKTSSGITFKVSGDNLTNSEGLTEGDPRDPLAKNGRPLLGRSVEFSIGVEF